MVKELEQQSAGKRVGLTFYSLDDPGKLDEVLRAQKYDLLLVDAVDADNLERHAQSVPSKPVVLPVVYQSSKSAAAAGGEEVSLRPDCAEFSRPLPLSDRSSHGVQAESGFEKEVAVVGQKGTPHGELAV